MGSGENALMVSLHFTTQESFRNQISRVSQSYKGDPADIVEKILRDQNYLDSTRKLVCRTNCKHGQDGCTKQETVCCHSTSV